MKDYEHNPIAYGVAAAIALGVAFILETPGGTLIESCTIWLLLMITATAIIEMSGELFRHFFQQRWTVKKICRVALVYALIAGAVSAMVVWRLEGSLLTTIIWMVIGGCIAFAFTFLKLVILDIIAAFGRSEDRFVDPAAYDGATWFDTVGPGELDAAHSNGHDENMAALMRGHEEDSTEVRITRAAGATP